MKRRQFMISTVGAVAANLLVTQPLLYEETAPDTSARTYRILGVPLRAGSLLPGSEDDAQAYREVQLLERLHSAGCNAIDDGNVPIPNYLPHHSIPPIRSWPAPRIAWECIRDRVAPLLQQPNQIPLLIGCDCSVVLGTTEALKRVSAQDVQVIYVDGDFDDAAPEPGRCQSAASCAVWLLTHDSPFWTGPPLRPSQVSIVGWTNPSQSKQSGTNSISLTEVRRSGPREAARRVLEAIPATSLLLLHIDIDVLRKKDLPAAYFPHTEGLSISEAAELLGALLKDPRIRIIEISEYASLRDTDREYVKTLVNLLAEGMKK
jgi:arginase family enzyme